MENTNPQGSEITVNQAADAFLSFMDAEDGTDNGQPEAEDVDQEVAEDSEEPEAQVEEEAE
jgi:hypothetical protein